MRPVRVLAAIADASLAVELELACEAAGLDRGSLAIASSWERALELARARPIGLVVLELGHDPARLREFASALRSVSPHARLVGVREGKLAGTAEAGEVLVAALRAGFSDALDRPLSSRALRPLLEAAANAQREDSGVGCVVAFHSTKGGVGKSTLSINVACGLALRHPDEVLLIDASLQLGVCSVALDLAPETGLADAARERDRLDGTMLRQLSRRHASGLRVLAAPRDPNEATAVDESVIAQVIGLARREFAFVVVDTLPVVDGLTLAVFDSCDRIYLVNQGSVPDVIGAERLLRLLDDLGIDEARRRVVLNRNLGRFAASLSTGQIAERLGAEVAHEVGFDRRVPTALNLGSPRVLRASRRFGFGRAIARLCDEVEALRGEGGS